MYKASKVELRHDTPAMAFIKSPRKVIINTQQYFFKKFWPSVTIEGAKGELDTFEQIASALLPPPPAAYICHLHGVVVHQQNRVLGMLFPWIEHSGTLLSRVRSSPSPSLKRRWWQQIQTSLEILHEHGIIWGDVKPDNILIDKGDNAWIIDFGGGYTRGWVDPDKAGTIKGDLEGMAKISQFLS